MSSRNALLLALSTCSLLAATSPAAAAVKLTYRDFAGATRPVANTKIKVYNPNGQELKTLGPSNADGVISASSVDLANQNLIIVAIPTTNAISLNPDKTCFGGFLNWLATNKSNFYPNALSITTSQLKSSSQYQLVIDGKAVMMVEAAEKSWQLAKNDLGVTVPRIPTQYNPCKFWGLNDCGGANACYQSDSLVAWDSGAARPQVMKVFSSGFTKEWDVAFVVAHEVGHFVHYALNRNNWPSSPVVAIHHDYTVSHEMTAWKEGFASFFANVVVAKMGKGLTMNGGQRPEDPRGYEDLPQYHADIRGITNEGHVSAFLWDVYPIDSRWAEDELFSLNNPTVFKKILWDNAGSINTARDFYQKARALIASGGASVPASDVVGLDYVWDADMVSGFPRVPYAQNFDCPAATSCGDLTHPSTGFWDVLNFAKVDVGAAAGGGRNLAMSAHYGDEWIGNANTPSFTTFQPGITRNSRDGLWIEYRVTFPEDLSYTRLRFSLMAGVNGTWPALSFTVDPYSENLEIVSQDPSGNILGSRGTWINGPAFAGRTVKIQILAEPIAQDPRVINSSQLIFQVVDASNPATVLGETWLDEKYNGSFTFARFDHDAPNVPVLIDDLILEQL